MDENSIRDAVQRFRFDRFKAEEEEWVYYVQRFETELALHRLLVGDNTADTRRNLLLSKARKEEETVTQFLIALRAIAGNCEFGASLSERLRDQLAIGINNDAWQKELFRLHTTNDATLQQVEASALILEQASTQQESIRQMAAPQEKGSEVHRLREARKQIPQFQRKSEHRELDASRDCVRCGYSRHKKVEECPAKGQTCNACGGLNHYARVCLKSGKVSIKGQKGKKRINAMKQAKETGGTESSNDDDQDISCGEVNTIHIRAVKGCAARLEAEINGVRVKMLYDPGAARSVISEHTWRKVGAPSLKPTDTLVAYTNVPVETLGETEVRVRAFGRVKHLLVSVVKEQDKPLFGLDWCVSFNLNMPKGVTICNVKPKLKKESGSMEHQDYTELASLLLEFGELFAEEPGTIVGHKAVVHLKEGAVPKLYSARPIPFPMKKAVEDELNRLVKQDILEIVDTTKNPIEWAPLPWDTLVHYREELPLILETDASDRGVGAVLLHQLPDKSERPVAFASRTFLDREKNYSVIDKEALAIIFGVTKFYQYVYGRKFTLRTDHKPLEHILGANQEIPKMAANRLQRWAITLSAYQYDLQYVKGKENLLADPLSRLPMNVSSTSAEEDVGHHSALLNVRIEDLPMSKRDLQKRTRQDPLLAQVINCVDRGWPSDRKQIPAELLTFYEKRETLSFEENILLWQGRIVVPTALHRNVLDTLHEGHPGIWAMRALASWNVPTEPWQRIHIDYAGPFEGSSWLVVVDAFSKWIEIKPQRSTTTSGTVKALREIFCRFGLPRVIVSDNGPQFSSQEFKQFCDSNNIVHIRSTPYHPKTNGLAERAVRTFKERFLASQGSTDDVELRLQRFLLSYRNTPHKSTGRAPAEMLMGRKLRTKLDLLKPDPLSYMDQAVIKQKLYHDQGAKLRIFRDGGYNDQQAKETGGQVKRKHADQLRTKMASEQCISEELMHNDPARVNGRQVLDVDATHTETQGTKRGDEGSHQVPHRSPEVLKEGADGCQGFQTSEVPGVPTISNETVQDEQTHKTNGSTHTQEEQEEPTLPTVSSGSVQQKERPKRDRRPPSRPYDKYLSNPRAK
eukprot:Em0013g777a